MYKNPVNSCEFPKCIYFLKGFVDSLIVIHKENQLI